MTRHSKPEKSGIVQKLKMKHQKRLARAAEQWENKRAKGRSKTVGEIFSADIFLFQRWACRVRQGCYGFDLGDVPRVWADLLNDLLAWMESQCPDFEILQIKMKCGGLRFYIDTKIVDEVLQQRVGSEINQLEILLRHDHH